MKKARKGFTLVELLIVVAILATLTAAMTVSMSGSTAKAKAAQIAANVDACKTAAALYYANHFEEEATSTKAVKDVLEESIASSVLTDFTKAGAITYTTEGSAPSAWALKVDFSKDGDATAIATALKNIKGYSAVDGKTSFSIILLTGAVTSPAGE